MRRILLLLSIFATLSAAAQGFNNEWIDYSKTYFKFKVPETGLYHIPQSALQAAGLGATNADQFQLWRNGVQVPIFTSSQGAPIGTGGYLEFWGLGNDGKADKPLYREPDYQLSDKYSLQTDTAFYFLTVNPNVTQNSRLVTTVNNVAGNTLSTEPYFMYTMGNYFKNKINLGRAELVGTSYTYSSSYDKGEGWTTQSISPGTPFFMPFANISAYTGPGAPDAVFRLNAAGDAVNARHMMIRLNTDSIAGPDMDYYDYIKFSKVIPVSQLGNTPLFDVSNMSTAPADRMVVAQAELTYPHDFNFGGASSFEFSLPANGSGNYLEISSFSYSGPAPVLYDLTNGKRYSADISTPSILKFALLPSGVDRNLVLVGQNGASYNDVSGLQSRNFINYLLPANQGDFLMVTNPVLGAGNGTDPIGDYQAYRSSAAGGGFTARAYMIDQLVDQFAFGIKMHPLAVRNFIQFARANFSLPVKNILLIGKAVVYRDYRAYENTGDINKLELVPTFGYPASDNLMSAVGNSSIPLTPIGRLSVINKEEIGDYLEKVISFEQVRKTTSPSIDVDGWRKNVIHVVGASDDVTSDILQNSLEGFRQIIEDTLYGGKVSTFKKTSSDAVQQLNNAELSRLFNTGIGFLTYFGHSSATTLEFNLDNPDNYSNQGRYPIFNVMGCNAGNFYTYNQARLFTKETISERYVLAKQRGSVAFLASTHLGIVHYLDIYATRMYRAMSRSYYGGTLGEIMDEAIRQTLALTTENDFYARFQCEQFTLHGDPALRMYTFDKPDYVIEEPLVKIAPNFLSVAETEFRVNASFQNIGKATGKKIVVELKRTYPGQTVPEVIRRDTIPGIRYIDSLSYTLPIVATRDKGLNKITITVDADNDVDELYETNNTITKDVFIFEDEIRPVSPYNLSIVNTPNIKLTASTANAFATSRDYIMEMDTTELFNSPAKITRNTTSGGGIVEFTPGNAMTDSTVYYWRVAQNVSTGEFKWNGSSFVYIPSSGDGFSQSHLYQQLKSEDERIKLDSTSRTWKFADRINSIFVHNGVYPTTSEEGSFFSGTINNANGYIGPGCAYNELIFNVIDSASFQAWRNDYSGPSGLYNSYLATCGGGREYNFEYQLSDITWRQKAMNFIDLIPAGFYVVVRSNSNPSDAGNTFPNVWKADAATLGAGNSLWHKFYNQGFTDVDSFNRARSFTLIFKKDGQNTFAPRWTFSEGIYDAIVTSANPISPDSLGYITSPVVGPAKAWNKMKWKGKISDATAGDLALLDVIGVTASGTETVLFPDVTTDQTELDISSVSAEQYPFMKLRMRNSDSLHYTPYQLRFWMLTYDPVPEGAIAPNMFFTYKDTLEAGEPFNFGVAFKNISKYDFDSVKVKLTITDKNNVENIIPVPRQKKLTTVAPNDTIRLNVPIDSRSLSGHNTLFVNFNPDEDQPEQSLFNNYAFRNLYVKPDSLNPLLDVTFDGVHILNRDIVASRPSILVKLKDEARWMVLDDTSLVSVKVRYPDGSLRSFYFNNSDTMQWIPAGQAPNPNNEASINLKPYFPLDGEYELIVSGKDQSDNTAGRSEYKVAFQVINKPMISNMLNYPNPFTTSTAFVFTLTGSEIPQNIRIQVLTITGKIVREITKDELGPLHIGRNMTEFKWDGTDQYGSKLANGIYLYRVITSMNGKSLDKYKSEGDNTDKYFNKGYGKMYLMR